MAENGGVFAALEAAGKRFEALGADLEVLRIRFHDIELRLEALGSDLRELREALGSGRGADNG